MVLTNFPNGISSFGIPIVGGGVQPYNGNYFFVDPASGSDGNTGSADSPYQTIGRAYNQCVSGNNDVVFLYGNGLTSGTARLSATLTWAKDSTHLIGVCAPTEVSQRARIAATSGVNFTPLVKVTGAGCQFANFSVFHGYDVAVTQIAWQEASQRNAYTNVSFQGVGHATAGDQAGSRSLLIDGGAGQATPTTGLGENTFIGCTIGLDTIARSTTNASLEFSGATPRNTFRSCIFPAFVDSATALFVKAGATGSMDRWQLFEECSFINTVKSTSTAMTGAFSVGASAGGLILLQRSTIVGATDIEATAASGFIFIDGGAPTGTTTALAINNVT